MAFHTFQNGVCTVCGEYLDYLADDILRERALIGPKLPIDAHQGTFQLSLSVLV